MPPAKSQRPQEPRRPRFSFNKSTCQTANRRQNRLPTAKMVTPPWPFKSVHSRLRSIARLRRSFETDVRAAEAVIGRPVVRCGRYVRPGPRSVNAGFDKIAQHDHGDAVRRGFSTGGRKASEAPGRPETVRFRPNKPGFIHRPRRAEEAAAAQSPGSGAGGRAATRIRRRGPKPPERAAALEFAVPGQPSRPRTRGRATVCGAPGRQEPPDPCAALATSDAKASISRSLRENIQ